jgi:hypothetical protein
MRRRFVLLPHSQSFKSLTGEFGNAAILKAQRFGLGRGPRSEQGNPRNHEGQNAGHYGSDWLKRCCHKYVVSREGPGGIRAKIDDFGLMTSERVSSSIRNNQLQTAIFDIRPTPRSHRIVTQGGFLPTRVLGEYERGDWTRNT